MPDIFPGLFKEIWTLLEEMAPYLLFGFLIAGILGNQSLRFRHTLTPLFLRGYSGCRPPGKAGRQPGPNFILSDIYPDYGCRFNFGDLLPDGPPVGSDATGCRPV
jgi:hypothetical protein